MKRSSEGELIAQSPGYLERKFAPPHRSETLTTQVKGTSAFDRTSELIAFDEKR